MRGDEIEYAAQLLYAAMKAAIDGLGLGARALPLALP
jgi:hypothetical protein